MSHRSFAFTSPKRIAVTLVVGALFSAGSPLVAISSASSAGGANKPVSATAGNCKNDNPGKHLGYTCPSSTTGTGLLT